MGHTSTTWLCVIVIASASREVVAGHVCSISEHECETLAQIAALVGKGHGVRVVYADPGPDDEKTLA